jgi:hypothetical protein
MTRRAAQSLSKIPSDRRGLHPCRDIFASGGNVSTTDNNALVIMTEFERRLAACTTVGEA